MQSEITIDEDIRMRGNQRPSIYMAKSFYLQENDLGISSTNHNSQGNEMNNLCPWGMASFSRLISH